MQVAEIQPSRNSALRDGACHGTLVFLCLQNSAPYILYSLSFQAQKILSCSDQVLLHILLLAEIYSLRFW